MFNYFLKLSISKQFFAVLLISIIVISVFSFIFESKQMSMSFFLNPSSLAEIADPFHFIIAIIEVMIGIVVFGSIVSLLTSALLTVGEKNRLKEVHIILKEAFETHSLIKVRKLLLDNNITTRRRSLNLQEAEILLEISKEDIVKSVKLYGQLRLRMTKSNHQVMLEDFQVNTKYGSFVDRDSSITIVSTQNYSDANTGHFAATLATSLNANYLANEFYSSGTLRKEKQINFAVNEKYSSMDSSDNGILDEFIDNLKTLKNKTQLFIYIGTYRSFADRKQDALIMYGGDKDEPFKVENPTYNDLDKLDIVYKELDENLQKTGLRLGTHEIFDNTNDYHLSKAIHNNFKKNTISLYVSTNILWTEDESIYYEALIALSKALKKL